MLALIILINAVFITGCWNYREVNKLAIVSGVAVDKGTDGRYIITAEIVQISGGRDTKTTSKTITMEGKTMFDAVRNGISMSGKRLYWSHSKVIILSKEIAGEGITKVIDWYIRDAEAREDVHILISKAESAKEIFEGQSVAEEIKCLLLEEIMDNQNSLSKARTIDILQYNIESKTKGMATVIPTVNLKQIDGKMVLEIIGTGIIKNDKLIGYLNGEETKDLLFIRNEVKGGVLVEGTQENATAPPVTLEIFKSKTKVTPVIIGNNIEIDLNIDTTVAIDEIAGKENYFDEDGCRKLEQIAENSFKERIESFIKKIQTEFDADIFGFGTKLQEDEVKLWKSVSNNWEEIFKDLKVNVKTRVHIKNSAILSKSLESGD